MFPETRVRCAVLALFVPLLGSACGARTQGSEEPQGSEAPQDSEAQQDSALNDGELTLFGAATPALVLDSDASPVELGVRFTSSIAGEVMGIRFFKGGSANGGTHTGHLWSSTGELLATATFCAESRKGWQAVRFASPVSIVADAVYIASYQAPRGRYSADVGYFASSGHANGVLRALKDGESGGNGVFHYGASAAFPTDTFASSNYWVDVLFRPTQAADSTPPTAPAGLTASAKSSSSIELSWSAASDDVGVSAYLVLRDGTQVAALNAPALSYVDTGLTASTAYRYAVKARDAAGNTGPASNSVATQTGGPTGFSILGLSEAQNVSGTAVIEARPDPGVSPTKFNFWIDSTLVSTVASAPYCMGAKDNGTTCLGWDSRKVADGTHQLKVIMTTSLATQTHLVGFEVSNGSSADTTNPTIAFTSPAAGASVSGTVSVTGIASDDVGVVKVELQVDSGAWQTASGTSPWRFSVETAALSNGVHTLTAHATDAAGHVGTATRSITVGGTGAPPDPSRHNCIAKPSACGYPDETNTGVPAGTVLKAWDGHALKAGEVLDGWDIPGGLDIQVPNVTLRRCHVHGTDTQSFNWGIINNSGGHLTVEDTEIEGFYFGIGFDNWTCRRCNIHKTGDDGSKLGSDVTLEDSWVHGGEALSPGSHQDCGQMQSGVTNLVLRHNTVVGCSNAAFFISPDQGPSTNGPVNIDNNLVADGNFSIFIVDGNDGQYLVGNISLTNNRFTRRFSYGPTSINVPVTESGNFWDDTGEGL